MKTAQTGLHRERNGRECRAEEQGALFHSGSWASLLRGKARVLCTDCSSSVLGSKPCATVVNMGAACSKVSGMEVLNHA